MFIKESSSESTVESALFDQITQFLQIEIERYKICTGPLPCHIHDNLRQARSIIEDILEVVEEKLSPDECFLEAILSLIEDFLLALLADKFPYQQNVDIFKQTIESLF